MSRKKKDNAAQSTRQLMGIDGIKDYCIATRMGDLVFFIIKPTNISVLPDSSIKVWLLTGFFNGLQTVLCNGHIIAVQFKISFEHGAHINLVIDDKDFLVHGHTPPSYRITGNSKLFLKL